MNIRPRHWFEFLVAFVLLCAAIGLLERTEQNDRDTRTAADVRACLRDGRMAIVNNVRLTVTCAEVEP